MEPLTQATIAPEGLLGRRVDEVRAFNRFYTNVIGVLREGLLGTPYSLTEARVLFELAQRDVAEVAELRRDLGLDGGYLSRMLGRFEADGLVTRTRSDRDRRRQVIRLTARGRRVFRTLDGRSAEEVRVLLAALGEDDQRRLLAAMGTIRGVLEGRAGPGRITVRRLRPGDYGWVIHRHGALYAEEYGWDEDFEAMVARIVADHIDSRNDPGEAAWIAEIGGAPVGCVFCVRKEGDVAQLRLLLVEPHARGMGVGTALVRSCLDFAREAGYPEIVLWTNDVLEDARRIYERAGFELVEEESHHSFGHDLVSQVWRLRLSA